MTGPRSWPRAPATYLERRKVYPDRRRGAGRYPAGAGHHGAGPRCGARNPHPAKRRPRRLRAAQPERRRAPPSCSAASGPGWTMTKCRWATRSSPFPTAEFSSLNLGQAVLLLGYEWLKSADATPPAAPARPSRCRPRRQELIGPVRASGARTGRGRVLLSRRQERNHGAQHPGHDTAVRPDRPGSAHHPRHDRGAGEEQIPGRKKRERGSRHRLCRWSRCWRSALPPSPLWRAQDARAARLLAGAIALFLLGVGGGTYWMLGQPYLALRAAQGLAHPRHQWPDRRF